MANRESGAGADPNNHVDLAGEERHLLAAMWAYRARSEREAAAHYEDLARRFNRTAVRSPNSASVSRPRAPTSSATKKSAPQWPLASATSPTGPGITKAQAYRPTPSLHGPSAAGLRGGCVLLCNRVDQTRPFSSDLGEKARDKETRHVLRGLLADEIEHSRIGWGISCVGFGLAPRDCRPNAGRPQGQRLTTKTFS